MSELVENDKNQEDDIDPEDIEDEDDGNIDGAAGGAPLSGNQGGGGSGSKVSKSSSIYVYRSEDLINMITILILKYISFQILELFKIDTLERRDLNASYWG